MRKYILLIVFSFVLGMLIGDIALSKTITIDKDTVQLRGAIDASSVSEAMVSIANSPKETVILYIESPGGSILAGDKFITFLHTTPKKVICVADFAASMAFSILQQCHKRYVTDGGILMQHVASWGVSGQDPNNRSMIKLIESIVLRAEKQTSKRLRLTLSKYRQLIRDDIWMLGNEAFKYRAIDGVVTAVCTDDMYKGSINKKTRSFFTTIEVAYSACPLVPAPVTNSREERSSWDSIYIKNINQLEMK